MVPVRPASRRGMERERVLDIARFEVELDPLAVQHHRVGSGLPVRPALPLAHIAIAVDPPASAVVVFARAKPAQPLIVPNGIPADLERLAVDALRLHRRARQQRPQILGQQSPAHAAGRGVPSHPP